jgi:hypothetical protein
MPTIADLVRVRPEVTSSSLHGIISLYSLISDEEDAFEKAADHVLSATFPSEALLRLLQRLQVSLSDADADRKGNFVFSGGYGSGKSHLLLTLYHVLQSPEVAAKWLSEHSIGFIPPEASVVILLPMNQLTRPDGSSVDYLWEPIFDALGYNGFQHTGGNFPTAKHIEEAVGKRRVFLIIDEIERWYMPQQQNNAQAQANLTFLQNLTEYCQDATNGVFTILTLLRLDAGIQAIIDRVDAFREDLTQAPDRRQIVLHRLVEFVDSAGAAAVVDAYIEQYHPVDSHLGIGDFARYREDMIRCYPFHPTAIETVFDRYSSVASLQNTSYQNSRGALFLLSHILREAVEPTNSVAVSQADLIRVGDISLTNPRIYEDLATLDTQLVNIARRNVESSDGVDHGDAVLSTVLLHSLGNPQATRRQGAELKDLLLGVLRPASSPMGGVSPNQVQATLVKLQDTAINLWSEENPPRWVFRADVNILTQVNRRAKTEAVLKQAPAEIVAAIHELVSGPLAVFPSEDVPDARDITIVVSTRYIERDDVLNDLYKGKAFPNGLVIVIPRSQGSIFEDPDLLWLAQTKIAAGQIRKEMMGTGEIPELLKDKATNQELLKALPGRYGKWLTPVLDADRNELHFRGIDVRLNRTSILAEVEKRYDTHSFEECVMDAVRRRETPPTVDDIRADFYRQRSYPKPVGGARATDTPIDSAIQRLVQSADLEVIIGGDAHYVCGKDPSFLQKNWTVAIPPEEHKPKFDARATITSFLAPKKEAGAPVKEIRARCHNAIKQYPNEVIEDSRIDDLIVELVASHQLEIPSVETPPSPPLSNSLVVRVKARLKTDTIPTITLGPGSPQSLKTTLIKDVNKTDKLSQVVVDLEQTAKGKAVAEKLGQVLGLQGTQVGDTTQLEVRCYLREAAVTNRDQLVQLLDALPKSGDPQVTVKFTRESPREQGDRHED